jgi:hypothetical protein
MKGKAKRNQGLFTDQAAAELIGCERNCLPELRLIAKTARPVAPDKRIERAMLHSCDLSFTWFSSRGVGPSEAAVGLPEHDRTTAPAILA